MSQRQVIRQSARGFTLLEVLVAIVILAIGLLGIAGLQLNNLRYSAQSAARAQASLLAEQMAERIRNNPTADYSQTSSGTVTNCFTASCTTTQQRDFDLSEMAAIAADPVRGGMSSGTISVAAASNGYTVSIGWQERAGYAGGQASQGIAVSQAAQLQFFVRPN
ncbi:MULTISPECIES: type IV pilus modification protein PilV [Aquitalea]|uniref:Type IV pilus assembly protein PilV n=1 Tax=Aquitalea magnusonii TaxID=332411 RepID=A0A318J752_9NEIS|nr:MULTISPECIES: type IV pilus modification protein PilV [Aquitalea]PXX43692.1 type IV pilus assembly protein PilV [Aquitalea magnusonii]